MLKIEVEKDCEYIGSEEEGIVGSKILVELVGNGKENFLERWIAQSNHLYKCIASVRIDKTGSEFEKEIPYSTNIISDNYWNLVRSQWLGRLIYIEKKGILTKLILHGDFVFS